MICDECGGTKLVKRVVGGRMCTATCLKCYEPECSSCGHKVAVHWSGTVSEAPPGDTYRCLRCDLCRCETDIRDRAPTASATCEV